MIAFLTQDLSSFSHSNASFDRPYMNLAYSCWCCFFLASHILWGCNLIIFSLLPAQEDDRLTNWIFSRWLPDLIQRIKYEITLLKFCLRHNFSRIWSVFLLFAFCQKAWKWRGCPTSFEQKASWGRIYVRNDMRCQKTAIFMERVGLPRRQLSLKC